LKTADGLLVTLPNKIATNNPIKNLSRMPLRRFDLIIPVSYGTDIKMLETEILNLVKKEKLALKDPQPSIRLLEYGDSNLNFKLMVWGKGSDYWALRYNLTEAVYAKLNELNISIDYNQLDLHIKDINGGKLDV
jgi:small conductance mechanosensitive channel